MTQKLTLIGLLAVSLVVTAVPALAKDHHQDRNKHQSYQSSRQHGQHAVHNKRNLRQHSQKYSQKHFSSGRSYYRSDHNARINSGHKYDYKRYYQKRHHAHLNNHGYRHHRYLRGHHLYRYGQRYYRYDDYVEDYFSIIGGTILLNELLYHSHENH